MPELIYQVVLTNRALGAAGGLGSVAGHPLPGLRRGPSGVVARWKEGGPVCQNEQGFRAADVLDLAAQRSQHPSREF